MLRWTLCLWLLVLSLAAAAVCRLAPACLNSVDVHGWLGTVPSKVLFCLMRPCIGKPHGLLAVTCRMKRAELSYGMTRRGRVPGAREGRAEGQGAVHGVLGEVDVRVITWGHAAGPLETATCLHIARFAPLLRQP